MPKISLDYNLIANIVIALVIVKIIGNIAGLLG
jgi:hypothetical protein